MYCLVEWGHMTEDEAFAAFEFIGSFDEDGNGVDMGELEAAFAKFEGASDEEIAAYIEANGASLE